MASPMLSAACGTVQGAYTNACTATTERAGHCVNSPGPGRHRWRVPTMTTVTDPPAVREVDR